MEEGDEIQVTQSYFDAIRFVIRRHFLLDLPHTNESMENMIGIVNQVEKKYDKYSIPDLIGGTL